jgi:hypothetical protein
VLRRIHRVVGLAGVVLFLGTGQYMDRVHDHLRGMEDVRRMLFRSAHIYLLWSSLLNLALGVYFAEAPGGWRRLLQWAGSALLLSGPALMLLAFAHEPWLTDLDRPYAGPAIYAAFAGMLMHLLGRPS